MKVLYLIRHAKSSWGHTHLSDFERPLNDRGIESIQIIGDFFSRRQEKISHFFSSSAARAHATGKGIVGKMGLNQAVISYHQELYHASPLELLRFTCRITHELDTAAIIGHNPGLTDYCNYLCDADISNIPTCGVVKIIFETESWKEISKSSGRLEYFQFPKGIED